MVQAWFGDGVEKLLCTGTPTRPPTAMSLDSNPEQTLSLLSELRNRLAVAQGEQPKWVSDARRPGGLRRISGYTDFSAIAEISVETALIIASEYDCAKRLIGSVPPTINQQHWKPGIFDKLYELGFFGIVGLEAELTDRYRDDGNVRIMRFATFHLATSPRKTEGVNMLACPTC